MAPPSQIATGPIARAVGLTLKFLRGRSAASAVVKNFGIRVAIIAVTLGTGIIVARTLAPAGRGEQAALSVWPIMLSGLATFGLPTAMIYQSRRHPEDSGRLYFVAIVIGVGAGLLVALLGAAVMPRFLNGYDPGLVRDAQWFMLLVPQCILQTIIRAQFESRGEFTRSTLGLLIPNSFTLAALLVLREMERLTPLTAALCYYVPSALLTVWLLARTWPRMVVSLRSFGADAAVLLSYGLRSYGTDVINTLSAQLDLAVIVAFLSPVALGLYSVSLTISRLQNIVQQSVVIVLFPHASGLEAEAAIGLVGRAARLSMAISFVLGAGLLLVVPLLLPLVYGPSFAAAVPIMPILMLEAMLGGFCYTLALAFLTTGRPAVLTLIQLGWLCSALAFLVILVPRMNITGAAVALLSASVVRVGLVALAYRVVLRRNLPNILLNMEDIAFVRAKIRRLQPQPEPLSAVLS